MVTTESIQVGARVRIVPGARTSSGVAGAREIGEVVARVGQSQLMAVRVFGADASVLVELRNLRPHPRVPFKELWKLATESELRAMWGDR